MFRATPSTSTSHPSLKTLEQTLSVETLNLFVYSIGMYQYALDRAKHLWGSGPLITPEGYSFSSGEDPDTTRAYLSTLKTLINFIQTQFDTYFERADKISPVECDRARPAVRIVYETALSTCKKGALCEMNESNEQEGYYKTALLLLFSLLQPSWDGDSVEEEDRRDLKVLVDSIVTRLYK